MKNYANPARANFAARSNANALARVWFHHAASSGWGWVGSEGNAVDSGDGRGWSGWVSP